MSAKVLIIATTPFSTSDSSRSLDSYFHFMDKENVRQIFSRNWKPTKGHCGELYQITDANLLKRWVHRTKKTGRIYRYRDLPDDDKIRIVEENSVMGRFQRLGTKHTPIIELLRGVLWRKKYWCTPELIEWLDEFKPDCIFYNFSNHIFTQQIALFVAERFRIPIITAIGYDYYFNDHKSISLAYHIYRLVFKYLTRKVFKHKGAGVYCSEKIKEKYYGNLGLPGEVIYLSSTVKRREFVPINKENPLIVYFGSIRLGRNQALLDIAEALGSLDGNYKIEVFSNESDPLVYQKLSNHPNVIYGGAIPYSEVQKKMEQCDLFVVAEGFDEENLNFTRYSLSTKAADALASGAAILAYGPADCGVIGYLRCTNAATVCDNRMDLPRCIRAIFENEELQQKQYDCAVDITKKNHTLERGNEVFAELLKMVLASDA